MSSLQTVSVSESLVTSVTGSNSSVIPVPEGCVTRQVMTFVPWDNEHNLVSKDVESLVRFVTTGICLPLLFVISFITNIINMIVFYKHGLKERINACLFTLSLVDLMTVSVGFSINSDVAYSFIIGKERELGPASQFVFGNYLIGLYGLVTASQMVYAVIAVERCLCITHPLLVKSLMSTRTTVVTLWVMIVVITGVNILVTGVRYSLLCVFDPEDYSISFLSRPTKFYYRHQFIMDIMYSIVFGLLFPGLSFFSVTVCTVVTAVKLKKLSKWRETVSSASGSVNSRDLAITRVIISTSVLFVICISPSVILRISFLIIPNLRVGGLYDNLAWITIRIYVLASTFNNTFNFFVYYTSGSKFRETTKSLFPFCYHCKSTKKKMMKPANAEKQ